VKKKNKCQGKKSHVPLFLLKVKVHTPSMYLLIDLLSTLFETTYLRNDCTGEIQIGKILREWNQAGVQKKPP
jgi:hypothetical protein